MAKNGVTAGKFIPLENERISGICAPKSIYVFDDTRNIWLDSAYEKAFVQIYHPKKLKTINTKSVLIVYTRKEGNILYRTQHI